MNVTDFSNLSLLELIAMARQQATIDEDTFWLLAGYLSGRAMEFSSVVGNLSGTGASHLGGGAPMGQTGHVAPAGRVGEKDTCGDK